MIVPKSACIRLKGISAAEAVTAEATATLSEPVLIKDRKIIL